MAVAKVVINEVLPNPAAVGDAGEWIELFNPTNKPVDLAGWQLDDTEGGSKPYEIKEGVIGAYGYLVYYKEETKLSLNNDVDEVRLFNPEGVLVDSTGYTNAKEEWVWARIPDGSSLWQYSEILTPGKSNRAPPTPVPTLAVVYPSTGIYIAGVTACPEEGESEAVQLKSELAESISMDNWLIIDLAGNKRYLSGVLAAGVKADFIISGSILNNSGDSISLKNPNGETVAEYEYTGCGHETSSIINPDTGYQNQNYDWRMETGSNNPVYSPNDDLESIFITEEATASAYRLASVAGVIDLTEKSVEGEIEIGTEVIGEPDGLSKLGMIGVLGIITGGGILFLQKKKLSIF